MRILIITDNVDRWRDYLVNQNKADVPDCLVWIEKRFGECFIRLGTINITIVPELLERHKGYRFNFVIIDKYLNKIIDGAITEVMLSHICPLGDILYTSNGVKGNFKKE